MFVVLCAECLRVMIFRVERMNVGKSVWNNLLEKSSRFSRWQRVHTIRGYLSGDDMGEFYHDAHTLVV